MENPGSELPPPGWYRDPRDPTSQRYWDGERWTEDRVPATLPAAGAALPARPTNGKAIAALVLGITWVCGIGSILALVFGYSARNEIEESGGFQQGGGMATAGIVLGWVGVGVLILYFLLYFLFGLGAVLIGESAD